MRKTDIASAIAAGALGLALAGGAHAAVPSPSASTVVEGQTVATVELPDGTEAEVAVSDDVQDVLAALNLKADSIASAPKADAATVAAAIERLMIIPAPSISDEVRPAIVDGQTLATLEAAEEAIDKTGDDAAAYVGALIDGLLESLDLTEQEEAGLRAELEAALAEADPQGAAVLVANPRVVIVPEGLNPGEGGAIQVGGVEFPGTTEDSGLFLTLQYADAEGTQRLDVVVPEAQRPEQGDNLLYSFELPGGPAYFVMTPMAQPIAE